MLDRCLYLVAVLVVAWAVTFALRALPFLLFAGHDRTLPPWVERLARDYCGADFLFLFGP